MPETDLVDRFTYHPPYSSDVVVAYQQIRGMALRMAQDLTSLCRASRELSLAITHLEEVVFWANAAIARRGRSSEAVADDEPAARYAGPG
jgi:hypothetical protein